MKKNGKEYIENITLEDGRAGWKSVTQTRELNRHLQDWLDKNTPQKKRRKKFGSF